MFGTKLLGVILSTLLTIHPVYSPPNIEFPFTRQDRVFARVSYRVDDLGEVSIGGLYHNYNIDYTVQIYCSSACQIGNQMTTESYATNHEYHIFSRVSNKSPSDMISVLRNADDIVQSASNNTYLNIGTVGIVQLPVKLDYGTITINIYFPALTEKTILNDIDARLDELSDWYFLKNFLMDKDIPSSAINDVKTYIDNGDYSSAVSYVENYYVNNSVTTNENNETVVNNYTSKETNLNTLYQTENNFSTQVETDFNNRMDDIDLSPTLPQLNPFIQSANWVTTQFNRMTNNNAFGQVLVFSLVVGLLMALIGRFSA